MGVPGHQSPTLTLSGAPPTATTSSALSSSPPRSMSMAMLNATGHSNPLEELSTRVRGFEKGFRDWVAKQSVFVEGAVATTTGAVQGAAIGGLMGTLAPDTFVPPPPPPSAAGAAAFNPQTVASLKQAQAFSGGPLVQARNFAVMSGVNAGISAVLKRVRGVEDAYSSMAAAFGSGVMFSLVSGMGGPNPVGSAAASGIGFAMFQGAFFVVGQKFSQPQSEDICYLRTRNMLRNLGLQKYEKNFKKGLLTDDTLPLLTDSALRDVKIPPGPRLLILDHIQRDPDTVKRDSKAAA